MHQVLQLIAGYMSTHRDRSQIDPLGIGAEALPHLFILEIEPGVAASEARLHIRLVGTALDRAFGRSVKGQYLDDFLHGTHSQEVLAGFRKCAVTKSPLWMRQVVGIRGRAPRFVEGVAFPVEPGHIYGGLVVGDVTDQDTEFSFTSHAL